MKNFISGTPYEHFSFTVSPDKHLQRLDHFLHEMMPSYSRAYLQRLIQEGSISLNGAAATKPSHKVKEQDIVTGVLHRIDFERSADNLDKAALEKLDVTLVAQEPDFLIINKPAGLVVHKPEHTSSHVTLVDWLLAFYPTLQNVGDDERPGIVHRLDMDTSGLMVIPRTPQAHAHFTHLFKERLIKKTYYAIVQGHPPTAATIDYHIMRHPTQRTKMAHSRSQGRSAVTDITVTEYLKNAALVTAAPHTGRTHQIRVHCAAWGHPIIGDTVYGSKSPLIARQALHAAALDFEYGGKKYHFSAPMPDDMQHVIEALKSKQN